MRLTKINSHREGASIATDPHAVGSIVGSVVTK